MKREFADALAKALADRLHRERVAARAAANGRYNANIELVAA
jgi:hypothetical protein